jgi:hypothetical protein
MMLLAVIVSLFIWPAIAFGFLLYYAWSSARAGEEGPEQAHKVPGE